MFITVGFLCCTQLNKSQSLSVSMSRHFVRTRDHVRPFIFWCSFYDDDGDDWENLRPNFSMNIFIKCSEQWRSISFGAGETTRRPESAPLAWDAGRRRWWAASWSSRRARWPTRSARCRACRKSGITRTGGGRALVIISTKFHWDNFTAKTKSFWDEGRKRNLCVEPSRLCRGEEPACWLVHKEPYCPTPAANVNHNHENLHWRLGEAHLTQDSKRYVAGCLVIFSPWRSFMRM